MLADISLHCPCKQLAFPLLVLQSDLRCRSDVNTRSSANRTRGQLESLGVPSRSGLARLLMSVLHNQLVYLWIAKGMAKESTIVRILYHVRGWIF